MADQLFSRSKPMLGDLFPDPYWTDVAYELAAVKKLIWRHSLQALTSAVKLRSDDGLTVGLPPMASTGAPCGTLGWGEHRSPQTSGSVGWRRKDSEPGPGATVTRKHSTLHHSCRAH